MKKILAIGAHPDDVEYGALGYLLKEKRNGSEIYVLVLTDGGNSFSINKNVRKEEEILLCQKYGFHLLDFGSFPDGSILFNSESISYVEKYIQEIKPDCILTHYPNDSHQDHIVTSRITIAAARYCTNILFYSSFSAIDFNPTIFVDVSEFGIEKRKAMELFSSQNEKNNKRNIVLSDYSIRISSYYGTKIFVELAEGFVPYKYTIMM